MTDSALTADQVHDRVHALRDQAATLPEKIELGKSQRDAILQDVRDAAGMQDVGELREFQGLPVIKSSRADHMKLLATGEQGEDVEVDAVQQPAPSGPEAPAVEGEPSGR
jgi:hypothetical protein